MRVVAGTAAPTEPTAQTDTCAHPQAQRTLRLRRVTCVIVPVLSDRMWVIWPNSSLSCELRAWAGVSDSASYLQPHFFRCNLRAEAVEYSTVPKDWLQERTTACALAHIMISLMMKKACANLTTSIVTYLPNRSISDVIECRSNRHAVHRLRARPMCTGIRRATCAPQRTARRQGNGSAKRGGRGERAIHRDGDEEGEAAKRREEAIYALHCHLGTIRCGRWHGAMKSPDLHRHFNSRRRLRRCAMVHDMLRAIRTGWHGGTRLQRQLVGAHESAPLRSHLLGFIGQVPHLVLELPRKGDRDDRRRQNDCKQQGKDRIDQRVDHNLAKEATRSVSTHA